MEKAQKKSVEELDKSTIDLGKDYQRDQDDVMIRWRIYGGKPLSVKVIDEEIDVFNHNSSI